MHENENKSSYSYSYYTCFIFTLDSLGSEQTAIVKISTLKLLTPNSREGINGINSLCSSCEMLNRQWSVFRSKIGDK